MREDFGIRGQTWIASANSNVPHIAPERVKSAPSRVGNRSPWERRRSKLLGLIREASWTENAFVKRKPLPDTDQMSSRPPSSGSNMSESVKDNLEDLESRISPLVISRVSSAVSLQSSKTSTSSKVSEASHFSTTSLNMQEKAGSRWGTVRAAFDAVNGLKRGSLPENKIFSRGSSRSILRRQSRSRSKYSANSRYLLSGTDSVIAERYNVRPNFMPLTLFRKGVRIVIILIKAGGCFRQKNGNESRE